MTVLTYLIAIATSVAALAVLSAFLSVDNPAHAGLGRSFGVLFATPLILAGSIIGWGGLLRDSFKEGGGGGSFVWMLLILTLFLLSSRSMLASSQETDPARRFRAGTWVIAASIASVGILLATLAIPLAFLADKGSLGPETNWSERRTMFRAEQHLLYSALDLLPAPKITETLALADHWPYRGWRGGVFVLLFQLWVVYVVIATVRFAIKASRTPEEERSASPSEVRGALEASAKEKQ
jgi:hypothetical protein